MNIDEIPVSLCCVRMLFSHVEISTTSASSEKAENTWYFIDINFQSTPALLSSHYSWVSLYHYAVNLSGVNLGCIDVYAIPE